MERTLDSLAVGEGGKVVQLHPDAAMRSRLQDIGIVEGTYIACLHKSPAGDPAAYRIRGAVIALRNGDAGKISVR